MKIEERLLRNLDFNLVRVFFGIFRAIKEFGYEHWSRGLSVLFVVRVMKTRFFIFFSISMLKDRVGAILDALLVPFVILSGKI